MFSVNCEVQGLIILTLIYTQSLVQSRDTSFMSLSRLVNPDPSAENAQAQDISAIKPVSHWVIDTYPYTAI